MALTNFAALTYGGWGTIGGNTEQDASASVGIVTLASNCTWTGGGRLYVGVRQGTGTLQVNSATLTAGNDLHVGVQAGTGSLTLSGTAALVQTAGWSFIGGNFDAAHSGVGTVTLQDSATLTTPGNFYLGFWGGNGTLNIGNNAALNKNGGGVFDIGDGAIGVVNQSGGTLTTGGELWVGNVGGATGTYNLSGGALTMNNWFSIGRDNANGTVNMTGGTLTKKGGGNVEIGSFGGNPHSGTVTLSGGLFDVQAGEIVMGLNVAVGTLNLNGGTLKVSRISGSTGTSTVHLNGGTNLATANQPAYLGGLTAVTVLPNGAIIDDGGFTIGIAQALLGDPAGDGGLTKLGNGTLALNGVNTYTNTTTVAAGTLSGRGTFAGPVTVAAGATLAPGASLGALTISNVLTLAAGSQTYIELNKTAVTNDQVLGTTAVTYGGTLILKNLAGQLVAGDTFTLFPVGTRTGAFAAVVSQTLGQTVAWDLSMLTVDGTVKVATAVALPVHLASSAGNGQLHLGWPLDQTGWLLQSQTNALVVGLGTNWVDVAGSTATNQMNFPIGPTPGAAFYRLVLP
jgi:autotransporter-associated beta strand protein